MTQSQLLRSDPTLAVAPLTGLGHWQKFFRQELERQERGLRSLRELVDKDRRAAWRRRVGLDAPLLPSAPDTVTIPIHHRQKDTA